MKGLQPSTISSGIPIEAIKPGTRNETDIETIQNREQIQSNLSSDQKSDQAKVQTYSNSMSDVPSTKKIVGTPSPLINTFEGLNMTESKGLYPPDITLAVSEKYLLEMVNVVGGVWTKQGEKLNTFTFDRFFLTGTDVIADPRIVFDNDSKRWFAAIMDTTTDAVHVSISANDDPTGLRYVYKFPFSNCPDQPAIGITGDKFAITANTFAHHCNKPKTFTGVQYTVAHKDDLLNGVDTPRFVQSDPDSFVFSLHSVRTQYPSSSSDLKTVSVDAVTSSGYLQAQQQNLEGYVDYVMLVVMTGEIPNVNITHKFLDIQLICGPPMAEQRGSSKMIDPIDTRVHDVEGYNGDVWLTFHEGYTPDGDIQSHSCIRLIQLDTLNKTVLQDFDLFINESNVFFPALSLDSAGNFAVVYTMSSKKDFPSLLSSQRLLSDLPNTLNPPIVLQAGTTAHKSNKFGDYIEVTADPSEPGRYWFAGQYPKTAASSPYFWATFIGNFKFPN
jgi:hypothetical protein